MKNAYPQTPDGRYFVVRGRLWRCSNPSLSEADRAKLVKRLMDARRELRAASNAGANERKLARAKIDATKIGLGERGPVWWTDSSPDYNRYLVKNTPYHAWYTGLGQPHNS